MPKDGRQTRERFLDTAHQLMLKQGFAATSIDQLLERTGLTKGTFFYHFNSKAELAQALVERYAAVERQVMQDMARKSEARTDDPVQQVVLMIELFEEAFQDMEELHPGCLFASYCYQNEIFTEESRQVIADTIHEWRDMIAGKLQQGTVNHRPRENIDVHAVADMFFTIFEGAFILAKSLQDTQFIALQLRNYRTYLELLFVEAGSRPALEAG